LQWARYTVRAGRLAGVRERYVVWSYTSKQARPIEYGVGNFVYSDLGDGRTRIVWTYSFKLKDRELPGYLGPSDVTVFV